MSESPEYDMIHPCITDKELYDAACVVLVVYDCTAPIFIPVKNLVSMIVFCVSSLVFMSAMTLAVGNALGLYLVKSSPFLP